MTTIDLYYKYPKIFKLMDDFYYAISSFIPNGWIQLVDWLCESIQDYIDSDEDHHQLQCTQVKEKYASLRFYVDISDDYIDGMITLAETISQHICMECGSINAKVINTN
jgi:hypothetical protein